MSSASTSTCPARTDTSSALNPVSTLTTPPGTSDVASTSLSVTAGSGRVSDVMRTTAFPDTSGGASRLTSPSSDEVSGATTPDDAGRLGDREVEVRRRDRVGRPEHLGDLVGPARVPDPAVDGAVHDLASLRVADALGLGHLADELVVASLHQLGDAVQHLAAVHRGLVGPARLRLARGPHRVAEVLARRAAGVGERRAVRGADQVGAPGFGPRERPADVELVGLAHLEAVGHVSGPRAGRTRAGRACRPRGRSPTPCSRRTATSGRSG